MAVPWSSCIGVGNSSTEITHTSLTLGYPPGYLSTSKSDSASIIFLECTHLVTEHCWNGDAAALDPQDFATTIQNWIYQESLSYSCFKNDYTSLGGPNDTNLWGEPEVMIPSVWPSVDPRLSGCVPNPLHHAHDPPRVLTPVLLDPATTRSLAGPRKSAEPGSVIIPTQASSTSGPSVTDDPEIPVQSQNPPIIDKDSKSKLPSNPSALPSSGQNGPSNRQSDPNGDPSESHIPENTGHLPADSPSISSESQDGASQLPVPEPSSVSIPQIAHATNGLGVPNVALDWMPLITVAGQPATVLRNNAGLAVGDTAIAPGSFTTIAGQYVSVGNDRVIVGVSTFGVSHAPALPMMEAIPYDSRLIKFGAATIIAGGSAIVIAGSTISVPPGADHVIIDGTTAAMPFFTAPSSVFHVGSQTFTANPSEAVIGSSTLRVGSPAITTSGTVVSLGPSGVETNSSIVPLTTPPLSLASIFTVAGHVITANLAEAVVETTTLHQGEPPITISDTIISLGPSGLQIGSSTTIPLINPLYRASTFTVAGQKITANPTEATISSATLHPGDPAITISGTIVSLGPSGLQIGSSTMALVSSATGGVLGGVIMSGFGPTDVVTPSGGSLTGGANGTVAGPAFFTGDGKFEAEAWTFGALGGFGAVLWIMIYGF